MTLNRGRSSNTNDIATVTTYTINSVSATTIAAQNEDRIFVSVCLEEGATTENVAIRLYPAATDNIFQGEVLARRTTGNDNLYRPSWEGCPDNVYTGEISAITDSGTVDVYVTEY